MEQVNLLNFLHSEYPNFFDTEKKIANYILETKESVIEMTIGELAKKCQVSEASLSRFCKKCGMKSFHHFKITLARDLMDSKITQYPLSNSVTDTNISSSLQNILNNKIEELTATVTMMDVPNLTKILELLKNARTVAFGAVGNTIPVAMDATYKFNQIGITAICNTIWETQLAYTYNLRKEDVFIAISNSGASKRLLTMMQAAKDLGVTTISITNSENSPLAQISDYHIKTATREKLFMDEYYFSRISAFTVIEILYLFLTVGKKDVYQSVSRHEQAIADDKI